MSLKDYNGYKHFIEEYAKAMDEKVMEIYKSIAKPTASEAMIDLATKGIGVQFIPNEAQMTKTPLNIVVVGKGAEQIMNSDFVKGLILEGDTITLGNQEADMVIGTTAVRTYHNTTQFLKGIVKKVRQEKETGKMAEEPVKPKKKAPKKKKVVKEEPMPDDTIPMLDEVKDQDEE